VKPLVVRRGFYYVVLMRTLLPLLVLTAFATPALAQPGAPQALTAAVIGSTVTLTWTAPAGAPPQSYVIEAAVVPNGPVIASLPVNGTTLVVPGVPNGVYFVRVRGVSGGVPGAASNEVTVSVASIGCPGPPSPPANVRVFAQGTVISLNWAPPAVGCPATDYIILAGTAPGLSNIAQVNMGGALGISVNAPAGAYFIRVVSTNQFGASAPSPELRAVLATNNFTDTLMPSSVVFFDITFTQTGMFQGRMTWIDPTIDLDLYLATPGCGYPPTGCTVAVSDTTGTNVEQVAFPVTAGETYRLWVDNFSNRPTSFTIENFVGGAGTPVGPGIEASQSGAAPAITKTRPQ
jgi:hypothetical protein